MNHKALATPLLGIFILLISLVQCPPIDVHGNFNGATDRSDDPVPILVVMVNLQCEPQALATPLQGIFILLISLVQCGAIDVHGNFDEGTDGSDDPAPILSGYGESAM